MTDSPPLEGCLLDILKPKGEDEVQLYAVGADGRPFLLRVAGFRNYFYVPATQQGADAPRLEAWAFPYGSRAFRDDRGVLEFRFARRREARAVERVHRNTVAAVVWSLRTSSFGRSGPPLVLRALLRRAVSPNSCLVVRVLSLD